MARRQTAGPKDWAPDEGACFRLLGVRNWEEAFVTLGYGDVFGLPVRSLHFRTERMRPEIVTPLIRLVPQYNAFEGPAVADAVLLLRERGFISSVEFGREGSPVLYLYIPSWVGTDEERRRLDDEEIETAKTAVKQAMTELLADEIGEDVPNTIRAWWD